MYSFWALSDVIPVTRHREEGRNEVKRGTVYDDRLVAALRTIDDGFDKAVVLSRLPWAC